MSTCDQKYLIIDYFFGELSSDQKLQFENHLFGCKQCLEHLNALAMTNDFIKKQERKKPDKELLRNYHLQLEDEFFNEKNVSSGIGKVIDIFIRKPSIPIRLAQACVLILIGIFIGKMTIWKSNQVYDTNITYQSSVEDLLLKNYLQETEMILLDVANLDPVEDQTVIFNSIQSAKYKYLLQKTLLLRDEAKELENYQLSELLDQIELILLELYNIEKSALAETLSLVKQHLKDSHLLIEIKSMNLKEI